MIDILNKKPDYTFLWKFVDNIKDIENKNIIDVVKEVYEATYYRYAMKWFEEKVRREQLEAKIIDKAAIVHTLVTEVGAVLESKEYERLQEIYDKYKDS